MHWCTTDDQKELFREKEKKMPFYEILGLRILLSLLMGLASFTWNFIFSKALNALGLPILWVLILWVGFGATNYYHVKSAYDMDMSLKTL